MNVGYQDKYDWCKHAYKIWIRDVCVNIYLCKTVEIIVWCFHMSILNKTNPFNVQIFHRFFSQSTVWRIFVLPSSYLMMIELRLCFLSWLIYSLSLSLSPSVVDFQRGRITEKSANRKMNEFSILFIGFLYIYSQTIAMRDVRSVSKNSMCDKLTQLRLVQLC